MGAVSEATIRRYIAAQKGVSVVIRTFKFRLRPNRAQAEALDAMLGDCCALDNACLEQRIDAYRRRGVSLRYGETKPAS